jgi:hypothetical protein
MLNNADFVTTHAPVKKMAMMATIPIFTMFVEFNVSLIAVTKRRISKINRNIIPELGGSPIELTKKRSSFVEIVIIPGIIPHIRRARIIKDDAIEMIKPFQENSNFLK